jgi:beta-glucosidase
LLLSHGRAVSVIRANSPGCEVGIALNLTHVEAASSNEDDLAATRILDGHINRWFLDPLYARNYPADMVSDHANNDRLPSGGLTFVRENDYKDISVWTDFLGINYYTRALVTAPGNGSMPSIDSFDPNTEKTEMGWDIYPEGLRQVLSRLHFDYQVPKVYITENGASYSDGPDQNGDIQDMRRQKYLQDHFEAAHAAIQNGVNLAGYFVWSFMDNFEWTKGYTQRFGIVWMDYESLSRHPKGSAYWFRSVIQQNGFEYQKKDNEDVN